MSRFTLLVRSCILFLVSLLSLFLIGCTARHADPSLRADRPPTWQAADPFTKLGFIEAYERTPDSRIVFERYLERLGPVALMQFLEDRFPLCHAEAHELGQVFFESTHDVVQALKLCGHGCTNGCMHGVISKALATSESFDIGPLMESCHSEPPRHKRGNCAHAIGHGLLLNAGKTLDGALHFCARLFEETLEYYCATGVFMEYWGNKDLREDDTGKALQGYSGTCQSTSFPAACYRYLLELLANSLSPEDLLGECLRLSNRSRSGCFHGFGAMYARTVGETPSVFPTICAYGTGNDQTLCIEGLIEKLADHDPSRARLACGLLEGEPAHKPAPEAVREAVRVCWAAANEKMYRLDKPTMYLYLR